MPGIDRDVNHSSMLRDLVAAVHQPGNKQVFAVGITEDGARALSGRYYRNSISKLLVGDRLRLPGFSVRFFRDFSSRPAANYSLSVIPGMYSITRKSTPLCTSKS